MPFAALRQAPEGCSRLKLGGAVPRTEAQSWRRRTFLKACRFFSGGPRCPLFNRDIGLNPNTAVAVDFLHTNHLGVMLVYCCHVVWEFLRSGIWRVAASNRTENFKTSVLGLRSELWAWYASRRQNHSTENLNQVADVTPGLFGSMQDPKLKTKAAETW